MQRYPESEPARSSSGRTLCSVRSVISGAADALWQADAAGAVTDVTLCRPALRGTGGSLDEGEAAQVDELWRKAVRCAQRFSAVYHVRAPGSATLRNFLVQAVPIFDERDEVRYWSGHATEVDRFADSGTRFISEATGVLSSSLNRAAIVNRLIEASLVEFADYCAVQTLEADGSLRLEGAADRRSGAMVDPAALEAPIRDALRTGQPQLKLAGSVPGLEMRSLLAVPLIAGSKCIGVLTYLESQRRTSFAAREIDVAVVVARQLAMALENINTFEREQRITERFRFLARVTDRLFTSLEAAKTLALLLEGITQDFADYAVAASLEDGRLTILARAGTDAGFDEDSAPELIAELRLRRSLLNGALKSGPLLENARPLSWMMVPLYSGDGVYGCIVCASTSRYYDSGDLELLEEIGRRASLALDHAESFSRERQLIETLQKATLPQALAPVEGARLSAIYRPAASKLQVGGDWYDAYPLDADRVLLTVGDVTGHGLEASVVMGKLRHALNVVALYEKDPARILDAAERVLLRRFPASIATAFAAIYDSRNGTLAYANAGHPYPLLRRRDGSLEELDAEGLPLGLRSEGERAEPSFQQVDDAAMLTFYTDGLTEATHDMLAGERRLHAALRSKAVLFVKSPAQFVHDFCLRDRPRDDLAVLVLNFVDAAHWSFEPRDGQAVRQARRQFVAQLAARAQPGSDIRAAELIFGELVAGTSQHCRGEIEIALEWNGHGAALHAIVRGDGRTEPLHDRDLWLVSRLGADAEIEELPGFGVHVTAGLGMIV
jgi:GAF domain-containing protein